jgi:hypothetical protein
MAFEGSEQGSLRTLIGPLVRGGFAQALCSLTAARPRSTKWIKKLTRITTPTAMSAISHPGRPPCLATAAEVPELSGGGSSMANAAGAATDIAIRLTTNPAIAAPHCRDRKRTRDLPVLELFPRGRGARCVE